jgi:hypothetical protein
MKRTLVVLSLLALMLIPTVSTYGATRTFNSPVRPSRLLANQFVGNANVFTQADPTPDGSSLTLTSATGRSQGDGSVTVTLTNGFTAPVTLTVYFWQIDSVTPANSCWVRLAPVVTGTHQYSQSVDSHYSLFQFSIPESTPFLITANAAITGNVYVDCPIDPNNKNSAVGY